MNKTSAKEVAAAAGVSVATVDRVLNNRGGVSYEKEQRVLEWARKLKMDRALNLRTARTMRIAVLIQSSSNPFHARVQRAFENANRKFLQFNFQFKVFHIDPSRPEATALLVTQVASAHDALVISAAHHPDITAALSRVSLLKIPIVTFVTDIRGITGINYIGPDNRQAGRVAGDLMGRLIGHEGGDVIVVAGMLSMIGHEEREMGFRAVLLERYPACKICSVMESRENAELAGQLVYEVLSTNKNVRGIYNASAGARPVVNAIKALGLSDQIIFITHELTDERRTLLQSGLIDVIIDQNPELEVSVVVEYLAHFFRRIDTPPPSLLTPISIHMRENCG